MKSREIIYNGEWRNESGDPLPVSDIYNKELLKDINNYTSSLAIKSDYANELFLYFYLPLKEGLSLISKGNFTFASIQAGSHRWQLALHAAQSKGLKLRTNTLAWYLASGYLMLFLAPLAILFSTLLLSIFILFRKRTAPSTRKEALCVIRSPATYSKMKWLLESNKVEFLYDDIINKSNIHRPNLYSTASLWCSIFSVPFILTYAIRDILQLHKDIRSILKLSPPGFVFQYYIKRIPHKCVFEWYLKKILKERQVIAFYTGNKEDRFAVIETRLCKSLGIKCICIPHGLEYSYRMPAGLAGDIFYCTTETAKNCLSTLYSDRFKFIFDASIAQKMFTRKSTPLIEPKIVFFTESREPEVNLKLIDIILKTPVKLYLKLHPKDNINLYTHLLDRITILENLDDSLCGNICLSRKSTILVEAIYNNSQPYAILIDQRDFAYVELFFPSLGTHDIKRITTAEHLVAFLENLTQKDKLIKNSPYGFPHLHLE